MDQKELLGRIRDYWNTTSDSEWYESLRTEEKISVLAEHPEAAFHPGVYELIRKTFPDLRGIRVLLPSSGDNHAAFAFARMGAEVTSSDISERQLENAAAVAARLGLGIRFVREDTMTLAGMEDAAFDLVYTSNGTLSWINDLNGMYGNIARVLKPGGYSLMYDVHPYVRPFSGEPWGSPRIVKSYHDVFPDLHWRLQDIVNAQAAAGLSVCELAELPAVDASFWYTFDELKQQDPEALKEINDWKKNPLAALPIWMALLSQKADRPAG